jgi:hypothetical protein
MEAVLVLIILLSFAGGLVLRWRWTVVLGPAAAVILGVATVNAEPHGYDMHGIGYVVGVGAAVLALVVWLIGRWMRSTSASKKV